MNKKISLGAAVTFMLIIAAVTFSITMVFSTKVFNDKLLNINERQVMYEKISEIDKIVRENYNGTIDEQLLLDSISSGLINGIGDKYARYFDAKEYSQVEEDYSGNSVSIGVEYVKDASGYIKIINVFKDSPAEVSGIEAGDLIIKVEDKDVLSAGYSESIEALKGEAGTKVSIVVRRVIEDIPLEVTRRKIQIPSVESRMLDNNNGYVKIKEFNDNTVKQFSDQVDGLIKEGAKALVFDVRNNPGGTLDSVAKILDKLLPKGDIVSSTDKSGKTKVLYTSDANEVKLPMVVITNKNTASAAELFAAGIRDFGKGKLVGNTTFGKGVMQRIFKLNDGSAIDITIAKYNPPSGVNFDGVGVKPDFIIDLTADQQKVWYELDEKTDPQISKAIQVVNALKK